MTDRAPPRPTDTARRSPEEASALKVDPASLVLVGAISGAFGVKGEVRVRSFTAAPEGVVSYGPLYDAEGRVVLTPKRWRVINDGLALTGPEIRDRDAAERLKSTPLHVPRHLLPPPEDDEFYHVDLIGCRAETLAGDLIGEVLTVQNFGAGDVLEIRENATGKTRYVEFSKADVPVVDLPGRRLVITAVEGA